MHGRKRNVTKVWRKLLYFVWKPKLPKKGDLPSLFHSAQGKTDVLVYGAFRTLGLLAKGGGVFMTRRGNIFTT